MTSALILQLTVATLMVIGTVLLHLSGLSVLLAAMRLHARSFPSVGEKRSQALTLLVVVLGLFALDAVEIWAYAALYLRLGAVADFEQALYFSTATYTTLGYGDLVLSKSWRILGAIEGANGLILLGWSTAFFVSVLTRIRVLEADWLLKRGQPPR